MAQKHWLLRTSNTRFLFWNYPFVLYMKLCRPHFNYKIYISVFAFYKYKTHVE